MADQVTGVTGNLPGGGLGGISGALQGRIGNLTNMGTSILDKFFPPQKREEMKEKLTKFATEKPMLASFIFSQIAISGLPLVLFIIMSITVFIFALIVGLLVGLVGALLFVVFAIGVALFFLLPTLFVTTFFAVAIWLWGMGAYSIIKMFNEKKVPGIHVPLKDGLMEQTGLKGLPALQGTPLGNGSAAPASPKPKKSEKTHRSEKSTNGTAQPHTNGTATKSEEHAGDEADTHATEHHTKKSQTKNKQASTPNKPTKAVTDTAGTAEGLGSKLVG